MSFLNVNHRQGDWPARVCNVQRVSVAHAGVHRPRSAERRVHLMAKTDLSLPSSMTSVRLSTSQVDSILDQLDAAEDRIKGNLRQAPRFRYRNTIAVHMQQPGSSNRVAFRVPTRNISVGGLSLLHGGFVHSGTNCLVQLISVHGAWTDVGGVVTHCHFLEGRIHEVGLAFEQAIDPSDFTSDAVRSSVLLAEDDPTTARLVAFHLSQLQADVEWAENGRVAVDKALANSYDIILMDIEMPVLGGLEAIAELRQRGYTGPIVAVTALTAPEDQSRCLEAGADRYLPMPYGRPELAELLKWLKGEPLLSTMTSQPDMAELIAKFVSDLPTTIRDIEEAVGDNDARRVEQLARQVKGKGDGFGFEFLSVAGASLEKELLDGRALDHLKNEIAELISLCHAARAPACRPATKEH